MKSKISVLFVSPSERERYLLSTPRDLAILAECKKLEKKKLSPEDRRLVRFLKTQLERDWRKPLIKELGKLKKKYNSRQALEKKFDSML